MIITEEKDFLELKGLVNQIFDTNQSFPNQVFKKDFGHFTFEEFNWTEGPEFWDTSIQILGKTFNDTEIIVMIIDQDLQDFYFRNFGFYTVMKMPLTFTGEDYWRELHTGPQKASHGIPYDSAETVVWMSLSGKWAIWGERSYCTCVLGFAKNSAIHIPPGRGWWRSAPDALYELIDDNFTDQKAPKEFAETFIKNYSESSLNNIEK